MELLEERGKNINNNNKEEWLALKHTLKFRNLIFKFKNRIIEKKCATVESTITGLYDQVEEIMSGVFTVRIFAIDIFTE